MTVVKLRGREDKVLTVSGLSPVMDLKPYATPTFPQDGVVVADWMRRVLDEMAETERSE